MGINWSNGADSIIFTGGCAATWTTESLYCAAPQRILSTDTCCGICSSPAISGGGTVFAVLTATGLGLIGHFLAPHTATSLLFGQILGSNMYVATILCRVLWGPGGGIQRWHGQFGILMALGSMPLMASVALSEDYHLRGFSNERDFLAAEKIKDRVHEQQKRRQTGKYPWTNGEAVSLIYRAFKSHERHVAEWTIGAFALTCIFWWTVFIIVDVRDDLWQTNCDAFVEKSQGRLEIGACIAMLSFMTFALLVYGYQLWIASKVRERAPRVPRAVHENHFTHMLRRIFLLTDRGTWEWRLRLIIPFTFWGIWAGCILSVFKVALANFLLVGGQPWSYGVVQNMILASTGVWGFFSALRSRGVFVRGSRGATRRKLAAETPTKLADRHKEIVEQGVPLEHRASEAVFDGTSSQKIASAMTAEAQFSSQQKRWFKKCLARRAQETKRVSKQMQKEGQMTLTTGNEGTKVIDQRDIQAAMAAEEAVHERYGLDVVLKLAQQKSTPTKETEEDQATEDQALRDASKKKDKTTKEQARIWFCEILSLPMWENAYIYLTHYADHGLVKKWLKQNHVAERRRQRQQVWQAIFKEEYLDKVHVDINLAGGGSKILKRFSIPKEYLNWYDHSAREQIEREVFSRMRQSDDVLKLLAALYPNSFKEFGKPKISQLIMTEQYTPLFHELAKEKHANFIYAGLVDLKHRNRYIWPHKQQCKLDGRAGKREHVTIEANEECLVWNAKMYILTKYSDTHVHSVDHEFAQESEAAVANTSPEDRPLSKDDRANYIKLYTEFSRGWAVVQGTAGLDTSWIKVQLRALKHAGWYDPDDEDLTIERLIQAEFPGTFELNVLQLDEEAIPTEMNSPESRQRVFAQPKEKPLSNDEFNRKLAEYAAKSAFELWKAFSGYHRVKRFELAHDIVDQEGPMSAHKRHRRLLLVLAQLLIETENPGSLRESDEEFFSTNKAAIENSANVDQPISSAQDRTAMLTKFDALSLDSMRSRLGVFKLASHGWTSPQEETQGTDEEGNPRHKVLSIVLDDCLRPGSIDAALSLYDSSRSSALPAELVQAREIVSQGKRQTALPFEAYKNQLTALVRSSVTGWNDSDFGKDILEGVYDKPKWVLNTHDDQGFDVPTRMSAKPGALRKASMAVAKQLGSYNFILDEIATMPHAFPLGSTEWSYRFANASLALEYEHPHSMSTWDPQLFENPHIRDRLDLKGKEFRNELKADEVTKAKESAMKRAKTPAGRAREKAGRAKETIKGKLRNRKSRREDAREHSEDEDGTLSGATESVDDGEREQSAPADHRPSQRRGRAQAHDERPE